MRPEAAVGPAPDGGVARAAALLVAVVGMLPALVVGGCIETPPPGVIGLRGKVAFDGPTTLMFQNNLAVGSTFTMLVRPRNEEVSLAEAFGDSADTGVLAVTNVVPEEAGTVQLDVAVVGPGQTELQVLVGGEILDFIPLSAVHLARTELVDRKLINVADAVDARLPAAFHVLDNAETGLLLSALDRCGGAVLDLGASRVGVELLDETIDPAAAPVVEADGVTAFKLKPAAGVTDFRLALLSPGLQPLHYDVGQRARGDVDEVRVSVAAVDVDNNAARLWGRAFVDDVDLIGLDFSWASDPRVILDANLAPAVTAVVQVGTAEEPDTRPATVRATAFGETGQVDLLAGLQREVSRGPSPLRPGESAEPEAPAQDGAGLSCVACSGGDVCDPFLAAALLLLPARRRLRPLAALSRSA